VVAHLRAMGNVMLCHMGWALFGGMARVLGMGVWMDRRCEVAGVRRLDAVILDAANDYGQERMLRQ
jgi:hypothetical protein